MARCDWPIAFSSAHRNGPLSRLAQVEESDVRGGAAGRRGRLRSASWPTLKEEGDAMPKKLQNGILFQGENMFVIRDGKRIAKRNQQTKNWISLEPGWQVFDADDGHTIEIVYRGMRVE